MEQNSVELSQSRLRDNILISIKDENGFIAGDESAISELDEGDEDDDLNLPRKLSDGVKGLWRNQELVLFQYSRH